MRLRSHLEIDLSLLDKNINLLNSITDGCETLFMVKADAYGHGLIPVTKFTHFESGIKEFGCASLGEALTLRHEIPHGRFEIYVFSDVNLEDEISTELYVNNRIIPVVSDEVSLELFLENSEFSKFPLCLKFNTGMNRLGIDYDKLEDVIRTLKKHGRNSIDHLMTHFSSASLSMKTNKRNIEQRDRFSEIKSTFKSAGISIEKSSIANSGAIEQGVGFEESHVRPGLMLYGPSSLMPNIQEKSLWQGSYISQLKTNIIKVFEVEKGTPIGYGASACPDRGVIAIVALGYGDGLSTTYTGTDLRINNREMKIVGRVNMDMTCLLLKEGSLSDFQIGDSLNIWDHDGYNVSQICKRAKMIPYEVFTSVSNRVPKVYI